MIEKLETQLSDRRAALEALTEETRQAGQAYEASLARGDTNSARTHRTKGRDLSDEAELVEAGIKALEKQLLEAVEEDRAAAITELCEMREQLFADAVKARDRLDRKPGDPEAVLDRFRTWANLSALLFELSGDAKRFQLRTGLSGFMLAHADACESLAPYAARRELPRPWAELEARARRGRPEEAEVSTAPQPPAQTAPAAPQPPRRERASFP